MPRTVMTGLVAAVSVLVGAASSAGQTMVDFANGTRWLGGYVVNAPEQLLGGGVVVPVFGPWGLHLNGKTAAESPGRDRMFDPDMTPAEAEELGDQIHHQRSAWTSVNLALVRGMTRELALYLGGGVSSRRVYIQYVDEFLERGHFGRYWVEDEDQAGVFPNVVAGGMFRLGRRLVFQFGGESAPAGFTVGALLLVR